MGERISFFKNKSFIILHNTEEVSEGANLLRRFFWIFTGHGEPEDHARYRSDFASFYSCAIPTPSELQREGFEVEILSLTAKDVPDIFFDRRDLKLKLDDIPRQKVICLVVNGERAGVYFVKSRVLVASDWTHNSRCISVLRQLLPALSKVFRKRSARPPKPRVKITFGADPEFELIRSGKILSASGVIAGGTDSSELIGRDGAGSQVEIRPAPSGNLRQFIENFRRGLVEFSRLYPGYSLYAQGDVYPLGGHIHISVSPNMEIIRLLDNWIGKRVIELSGKARGSYRKLGAIEHKPWGFEYRTPPAAIFLRRDVLYAILRIIKEVIKAYYSMDGVSIEPNDAEIERLQLKEEWQMLNDFIKEYDSLDKDVLRQWGVRRYKPKPRVDLVFRDDWASEIRSYVSSLLSERLGKLAKKLNTRGIDKVILFGFRSERGMVCNFESTLFEKIDFDYSVNSGEKAFGLPYDIRVAELTDDLKKMWEVVAEEIIKALLK